MGRFCKFKCLFVTVVGIVLRTIALATLFGDGEQEPPHNTELKEPEIERLNRLFELEIERSKLGNKRIAEIGL